MLLWRISDRSDLLGVGAMRASARWHTASPGKRLVYLAEHPAVALVEVLANLRGDPRLFPDSFQLMKVTAEHGVSCIDLLAQQLSQIDREDMASTQQIGDAWLAGGSSALLRIPSIPSPESWNYLLNPLHPDAASVTLDWARQIAYDKRLFHL
jgi:RES domain-containing protein